MAQRNEPPATPSPAADGLAATVPAKQQAKPPRLALDQADRRLAGPRLRSDEVSDGPSATAGLDESAESATATRAEANQAPSSPAEPTTSQPEGVRMARRELSLGREQARLYVPEAEPLADRPATQPADQAAANRTARVDALDAEASAAGDAFQAGQQSATTQPEGANRLAKRQTGHAAGAPEPLTRPAADSTRRGSTTDQPPTWRVAGDPATIDNALRTWRRRGRAVVLTIAPESTGPGEDQIATAPQKRTASSTTHLRRNAPRAGDAAEAAGDTAPLMHELRQRIAKAGEPSATQPAHRTNTTARAWLIALPREDWPTLQIQLQHQRAAKDHPSPQPDAMTGEQANALDTNINATTAAPALVPDLLATRGDWTVMRIEIIPRASTDGQNTSPATTAPAGE
jgi:hypothetical protein